MPVGGDGAGDAALPGTRHAPAGRWSKALWWPSCVLLLLSEPGGLGSVPKNGSWSGLGFIWAVPGLLPDLGASLVQSARSTPSSSTSSSRPASLGYSGAAGPRPITQSELATALALASTPESSSHTPTPGTQVWREGGKNVAWPPREKVPGLLTLVLDPL